MLRLRCGSVGSADPVLLSCFQFSGSNAEQMRKTYSEFCSRHTKALKLYKELYARDKRFQQFIRVSKPLQAQAFSWLQPQLSHPQGSIWKLSAHRGQPLHTLMDCAPRSLVC